MLTADRSILNIYSTLIKIIYRRLHSVCLIFFSYYLIIGYVVSTRDITKSASGAQA